MRVRIPPPLPLSTGDTLKVLSSIVLAVIIALLGVFFFRLDTYTAVVVAPPMIDTDNGRTAKFVRVAPQTNAYLSGVDKRGSLKLAVKDSHVPYFAWATDSDRFEGLHVGDVICVRDRGYRLDWLSQYPTFISYTEGVCQK